MSVVFFHEKAESQSWQISPFEASPEQRYGDIEAQIREGEGYISNWRSYKNLGQSMALFDGIYKDRTISTLNSNFLKYNIRKFVETLADVREIGLYASDAVQYKAYAEQHNKVAKCIYTEAQYPRALRKTLQWASVTGVGYIWPKCKTKNYGFGERQIIFEPLGLLDVLPVQVPKSNDVQDAYINTIYEYVPIAEAHALFPAFQSHLQPVDQINFPSTMSARRADFAEKFRYRGDSRNWGSLYAIDVEEVVPTPTGWTKMGEIKAGDYIFGGDGALCKVTKAHPVIEHESYQIKFSDNTSIVCSEDHQWITACRKSDGNTEVGDEKLRTTKEIFDSQHLTHRIESVALDTPDQWLPIDPYLLGLWLGDGNSLTGEIVGLVEDLAEIERKLHDRGHETVSFIKVKRDAPDDSSPTPQETAKLRIDGFERVLRTYGLLKNKKIPMQYLRASFSQRVELLKGLMDTDGWVTKNGNRTQCGWGQSEVHKVLIQGFSELLNSLGIKHVMSTTVRVRWDKEYTWTYTQFNPDFKVFNLARKSDLQVFPTTDKFRNRYINQVERVGKRKVRCLTVNSSDHTFLVGPSMIRTHNCEIRYTYVRDMRINNTGYEMPMGDPATSWFYTVPYVGQDIFGGIRNGQPFMRKAKAEDCLVYPQLRLLISSPSVNQPMYDGPGFDWDGEMPIIQYTVDDWPWEPGACSLIDAVGTIEATKRKHERQMDQVLTAKKDPPLGYDRTQAQGPKIEQFDIFAKSVRTGFDGEPKKVLQSVLPDEVRVETIDIEWEEILQKMEEQQLGINDLGNLVNLKANLNSDAFDKAVEAIGPIAKGIATSMEASNAKVAYRLKFLILQYIDTARVIEYIGPDNVTPETQDFDPRSLVPSHLADEWNGPVLPTDIIAYDHIGNPISQPRPSYYTQLQRAKVFAKNLRLINQPSTLLKITQLQQQTLVLSLFGRGFPIPPDYVAEQLNIRNFGTIPGDTLMQKYLNWLKLELGVKAEIARLAGALGLGEVGPQTGKQHAGGRPPKNAGGQPKMKDKGSNPRPVIATT